MSSVYKSAYTDLNGTVSFGGGGGGGGGGGRNRAGRRARQNNAASRRGSRQQSLADMLDFNNNGRVTDELAAGATIGAGVATMATPAPGARVAGGLTIAAGVTGYADASR